MWAMERLARHATMPHDGSMTNPDTLIGTAEAARLLGTSHRTIHRLVLAGKLTPALRAPGGHSGSYLFHREDIDGLAAARKAAS